MSASPHGTRVIERARSEVLLQRTATLTVIAGPDAGQSLSVDHQLVRVGTGEDADLVLTDPAVSRHHFELWIDGDGARIRDLGSTNGTVVQGVSVLDARVPPSATLRAGDTELQFEWADADVERPLSKRTNFGPMLGHSPAMRAAFALLESAAKSNATVLLQGESGTGKEVAARAIHEASPRADGPFLVFDCGAASESLIESHLFGHRQGAFTGATEAQKGYFRSADGGTLVLDEIGELPLSLQPKLLRAIETRTVTPLGETAPKPVDLRLIACTHRNLAAEVKAGRFRQDLFYRLSVVTVELPPLRSRPEEIERLLHHFMGALGRSAADLPAPLFEALLRHDWPGNVRELRNVAERIVVLPDLPPAQYLGADTDPTKHDAPGFDDAALALPYHDAKQRSVDRFERAYLQHTLEQHPDNMSEAARQAGLSRQSWYRLMEKHGLQRPSDD